jgi:hypothetical protein
LHCFAEAAVAKRRVMLGVMVVLAIDLIMVGGYLDPIKEAFDLVIKGIGGEIP